MRGKCQICGHVVDEIQYGFYDNEELCFELPEFFDPSSQKVQYRVCEPCSEKLLIEDEFEIDLQN